MSRRVEDWLSRVTIPDVYPRRDDPFRPSVGEIPSTAPPASMETPAGLVPNIWTDWVTTPGTRPVVYQRALNYQVTANVTPVPLTNGAMQCETIVLNIDSASTPNAFFGFGNSITIGSGIEIRAGIPLVFDLNQDREQWELQRSVEAIAAMLAAQFGVTGLGYYRAPRVVFDASDYFVVAASAVTVRLMIFTTPEFQ